MKIRFKKLHPNAIAPSYAKEGDAGLDITAIDSTYTQDYISYKTGLAFEIPEGYVGLLFPRSSVSKKDLLMCNSVGVIDSGYRGEVEFRFKISENGTSSEPKVKLYDIGDRVGQLIVVPYPKIEMVESDELSDSSRGTGGFGSTN